MEKFQPYLEQLIQGGINIGKSILLALVIYVVGHYLIKIVNKLIAKGMERRNVDPAVRSFVGSAANILMLILLFMSIVGALGVQMASFAALLASAGVAVGMALSGNLQNFAGGLVLLVLRPYKVGDLIELNGTLGVVRSVEIFNTILTTADNKVIFIPNNTIATGVLVNYSHEQTRRVDFKFGVDYGTDYNHAREVLLRIIKEDSRILTTPAPFIGLGELADSSINITVRVWVKSEDYWDVFFQTTEKVYEVLPKEGIDFPFPQVTVHRAEN